MKLTLTVLLRALAMGIAFAPVVQGGVVISNLGETFHTSATVDNNFSEAQSFLAGSTVTLNNVTLSLVTTQFVNSSGFAISLRDDSAGSPATSTLAGLTLIAGAGGSLRWDAPANTTLTSGLTYWIVATASAPLVDWKATSSVNQTGTAGWAIGDSHKERAFGGAWGIVSDSMFLSVDATAVPEPGSVAWVSGVGLLGFAGWRRWRIR